MADLQGGYGIGAYGTSPWGAGFSESGTAVASTYALANRIVRVAFTNPPLAGNANRPGDALNPNSWLVQRDDTGMQFTVLTVDQIDDVTFDLHVLVKLAELAVTHSVDASAVRDADGVPIGKPGTFSFPGLLYNAEVSDQARAAASGQASTDLANPPLPAGASPGGTLVLGTHGDYQNVTGPELVMKLVLRRWTTPKNGFFHLPGYGRDLNPKLAYSPSQLPALQASMEQDALQEKEVESADVRLTSDPASGTLVISASLKLAGQPKAVNLPPVTLPGTVIP